MIFVILKIEEGFTSKSLAKIYGNLPIEEQLKLLFQEMQDEAADALQILWNQEYLSKRNGKHNGRNQKTKSVLRDAGGD